ncbi:conjugative transfer protein trbB [Vibrio ishigakensis]|uniref:Conjugative transfer protein trbB n=1 Tax=Vibrio ishigakensis TaxID=1481914 RepID=A0A0B8PL96_9VIBR|nr:conjugative transfer protein trbB [Vibrio ishigakensis]
MSRKLESLTHHFDKAGLSVYLDDPNITELMLNPDGTLWIERQGEAPRNVATVRNEDSQRILNVLSDYHNETITANSPILECELPLDGSRFEGLIPPIVDNPSFVIRKKPIVFLRLMTT